ncbi:UNVERIFIED_CONTAM: hypothetical protein Sradi_5269000 [Sesamum radiatum]|uniref:Uncharacterized protein n=1 Tax=Sesamum radiatum TaxID=300843 RepID=A0AAW2LLQ0_SESRA
MVRSSAEEEYRSMAVTTYEITWVTNLLQDLGVKIDTPVPFFYDNKMALHITSKPVFHERTKHLEIDGHVFRDKYKNTPLTPVTTPDYSYRLFGYPCRTCRCTRARGGSAPEIAIELALCFPKS